MKQLQLSRYASTQVLVIGAGPAGLALAIELGTRGISAVVLEKRDSTTSLPKGQYLHAPTAELFRGYGILDNLQNAEWPMERSNGQGYYVNIAQGPIAQIRSMVTDKDSYKRYWYKYASEYPRRMVAEDYERELANRARSFDTVALFFGTPVVGVVSKENGVTVTVMEVATKTIHTIQSDFLVACDGARSFVRDVLQCEHSKGPTFGNQTLVKFKADLDDSLGRDGFFHSFVMDPRYAGWFGSKEEANGLWRYNYRSLDDEIAPDYAISERIRGALGMPNIKLDIVERYQFDYNTGLLRNWIKNNIIFAGDAAHWHTPWGGFGMNSSIQDVNNLGWKLALMLNGRATRKLLGTYEEERKAEARITVKMATYNALNYQGIIQAMSIGDNVAMTKGMLSNEAKRLMKHLIREHGNNAILHIGYQLGTKYNSNAIIGYEATDEEMGLGEYKDSIKAGARAPHCWLEDIENGKSLSSRDAHWGQFALVGWNLDKHWGDVAEVVGAKVGVKIKMININGGDRWKAIDNKAEEIYGCEKAGVLLIRPDGYIGGRMTEREPGRRSSHLLEMMKAILGQ